MDIRQLSPILQEKAKKELNEDPKRFQFDINALRMWLAKQPHLRSVNPSNQMLVAFLRGSKYSLERSKDKLDLFYTIRRLAPEFYENRDPLQPQTQEILKLGVFLPIKNCKNEDSPRTCLVRCGLIDPSKHHLSDLVRVTFMVTEILLLEDDNFSVAGEKLTHVTRDETWIYCYMPEREHYASVRQFEGDSKQPTKLRLVTNEVVVDTQGIGLGLLSQWTATLAKKIITCFEKAIPLRLKSIYLLNMPAGLEMAYGIFKRFLGEKLKKRIFVYNHNYEAVYEKLPKSILPEEYGGEGGSLQELTDYWKKKVESYRDYFLREENAFSDESLRPGKPKTTSDLFGVEGSFRRLEVD